MNCFFLVHKFLVGKKKFIWQGAAALRAYTYKNLKDQENNEEHHDAKNYG